MNFLAIDYGTKNIGLAISDDSGKIALPFHTFNVTASSRAGQRKLMTDLKNLIKLEGIERIIMGLPLTSDGKKTKLGELIFGFARDLEESVKIPVEVEDERLTSRLASLLPNKNSRNIHELSAQLLLQGYLDRINA